MKKMYFSKLIRYSVPCISIALILLVTSLSLTSCSSGVDVGEEDKVLTSFSITWPEGFNCTCLTLVDVEITVHSLDQNREEFSWNGTVDIVPTSANVTVEPATVAVVNGSAQVGITFYSVTEQDEETRLTLRYGDVMSVIDDVLQIVYAIIPNADYSAEITRGTAPLNIVFTSLCSGYIDTYEWDFGDGNEHAYEENPTHTYQSNGNYTVSLTVAGPAGSDTETKSDYIRLGNVPLADFTSDVTSGDAPLTVQFTDNLNGDIDTWGWDFDNDGEVDSTDRNPSHEYSDAGDYSVRLTVTGPAGMDEEVKADYITSVGWGPLGGRSLSEAAADHTSLFVYNGTPYIAFKDDANSGRASVMKYTGNSTTDEDGQPNDGWEYVGGAGFSDGKAWYTSLSIFNGSLYVAYIDESNSDKATVMKYYSAD